MRAEGLLDVTFPVTYAQRFATFSMTQCKGNILMYLFSAPAIALCQSPLPPYAECRRWFEARKLRGSYCPGDRNQNV